MANPAAPIPSTSPQPIVPLPAETSTRRWLLWSAIGLTFLIFGIAIGLFSAKFFSQSPSPSLLTSTPSPTLSPIPTPTPDSAADWKTYTDSQGKYSFQYPPDYKISTLGESLPLLNRTIYWGTVPMSYKECRGDCAIVTATQETIISGISATKIKGWVGEIGGTFAQSYIEYELKYPNQNQFFSIILWELPQDLQPSEYPSPNRKIQDIPKQDEEIFDQILSTFHFLK